MSKFTGLAEIEPERKFSGLATIEPERPAERLKAISKRFESPRAIVNALDDRDRNSLNKSMRHVDDQGDMKQKLAVSWYVGGQLEVEPKWVFDNFSEITKNFYGRDITPKESFKEIQNSVTFPKGKRLFRKKAKVEETAKDVEVGTVIGIVRSGHMAWLQTQQGGDIQTAFDTFRINESAFITDRYISAARVVEGGEERGESQASVLAFQRTQAIEQQLKDFNEAEAVLKDKTGAFTPEDQAEARERLIGILQDPNRTIGQARIEALKDPVFIELLQDIAAREIKMGTIELSPAMNEFNESEGRNAFEAFARNPFEITANLAVSGGISSIKPIGLSIIGGLMGGAPGAIAGGAAGTFETEYAARFLMGLHDAGVDITNTDQLIAAFSDSEKMLEIQEASSRRGLTVAAFEVLTFRLQSMVKIAKGAPRGARAINTGVRLGIESIGEGAGEAAGSFAAGDAITAKDVFSEMVGGFGLSATQVAISKTLQSQEEKRVAYGRSGGLMTPGDIEQIKKDIPNDQINAAMEKVENGEILKKAIDGDPKALKQYNETLLEDLPTNQTGAAKPVTVAATYEREGNTLRVTDTGLYELTLEDGSTMDLNPNSERQKRLIAEMTGLAVDDISPLPGIQSEVDAYVRQFGSQDIIIDIADKAPTAPEGQQINSLFNRDTGVLTLFADKVSPDQVAGLLRHEHFVHGMLKTILGEQEFNKVLTSVEKAMPEELAEIRVRYANVFGEDRSRYAEEVLALLVENENNLKPEARGIVNRMIIKIRDFLRRFTKRQYSRDEIKSILQNAYGKLRQRKGIQRDINESFSITPESRAVPKEERLKKASKQIDEIDEAFKEQQSFNRRKREQFTQPIKEKDIDIVTFEALSEKHANQDASIKEANTRAEDWPEVPFSITKKVEFSITPADLQIAKLNITRGINGFNDVIRSKRSLRNVMMRPEVGGIDFDYGTPGDSENSFTGGEGISNIIGKIFYVEQREPVSSIQRMIAAIATGKLVGLNKKVGGEAVFQLEESRVILTRKKTRNRKHWVVSSFEDKAPVVKKIPYKSTLMGRIKDPLGAVSLYLRIPFPSNMINRMDPRNDAVQFSITDDAGQSFNDLLNESVMERRLQLEEVGVGLPPETRLQFLRRRLIHSVNRLEQVVNIVGEKKIIPDQDDPALQAELLIGIASNRNDEFKDEVYSEKLDSLLVRALKAGFSLDDLGDYVHAKHAKERNAHVRSIDPEFVDGGSGLTNAQAQEMLDKFADTDIHGFAAEFYEKVTKGRLDVLLDGGLITQEDFDKLDTFYDWYVPLKRELDTLEGFGRHRTQIDPGIERTLGSRKRVKNPIVSAIAEYESAVVEAERNKFHQVLLKFLSDNPDEAWKVTPFEKEDVSPNEEGNFFETRELIVPADYVLKVLVNGKTKHITFADRALVSGIRRLGTQKGIRIGQAINKYLRGVLTTYNPTFWVGNFMRDLPTALFHVTGEKSAVMAAKVIKDLPLAMVGVWSNVRSKKATKWSFLYQDLKRQGGKVGWFDFKGIDEKKRELVKRLAQTQRKPLSPFKGVAIIADFVESLNEAIESGIRLSTYKNLIDAGDSPARAASFAKNVTVNFNRKGELGELMNSTFLFSNAAIQGSDRIFRFMSENRKKGMALAAGLAVSGFVNRLLLHWMSDEDDEYGKLSDFERDSNWILPLGDGTYLKWRVPYGYGVFKALGDATADVFLGVKSPFDASGRVLESINNSFNPLGNEPYTPTIFVPIVQLGKNKNFFGGKIRPDQPQWQAKIPDSRLYFRSVRKGSLKIAATLNELSGGSESVSGFIDISPENIDFIEDFIGGGSLRFTLDTVEAAAAVIKGEMPAMRKIPGFSQIIGQVDDRGVLPTIYEMRNDSLRNIFSEGDGRKFNKYINDAVQNGSITSKKGRQWRKEFYGNQRKARISLQKTK